MTTIASEPETGGGKGLVWLDESGGFIVISVANEGYTALHKYHVLPFDGTGAYIAPGGSQETDLNATAANLIALMQPIYNTLTGITPLAAYQSNSAHDGVSPFPYGFDSALTVNGTNTNAATSPATQVSMVGHGSDFSRWQTHLFGVANNYWVGPGRRATDAVADALKTLSQYLIGAAGGPGLGGHGVSKLTAVVTHSGQPIVSPTFVTFGINKRIARRLHV